MVNRLVLRVVEVLAVAAVTVLVEAVERHFRDDRKG